MKTRHIVITLSIGLLGAGFLIWKIFSKPLASADSISSSESETTPQPNHEVYQFPELTVGESTITPADLQWEFDLHTVAPKFADSDDNFGLGPPPKVTLEEPIALPEGPELRERVIASVTERKILYQYIAEKVKNFDLSDPSRFTQCLAQVNDVAAASPDFFQSGKSRERLKSKLCEQSIIDQYLNDQVFKSVDVSPSEIASYYRTHEKDYKRPLRAEFRQIVVASESLAHEIRKEIKPSNFAVLAKKHSVTPEAAQGGHLGPFSKEQLPTLFDIVFAMNIGEISGVIKSDYGFHIIMPTARIAPQTLSLAEATPVIKSELLRGKKLSTYQKWLTTAMNAVSVTSPSTGINQ
jgi:peptidyl-prolyl cis-trans isomerase C